jgi:hypothetical protein
MSSGHPLLGGWQGLDGCGQLCSCVTAAVNLLLQVGVLCLRLLKLISQPLNDSDRGNTLCGHD